MKWVTQVVVLNLALNYRYNGGWWASAKKYSSQTLLTNNYQKYGQFIIEDQVELSAQIGYIPLRAD